MGGGNKWSDDVRMSQPVDVISMTAEAKQEGDAANGSFEQATSFCASEHEVPFRSLDDQIVDVGTQVQIAISATVVSRGVTVGEVHEDWAKAMQGCLEMGYRMSGTVLAFNPENGTGTLRVAGKRVQPT